MGAAVFWMLFGVSAIWLQFVFPGLDVLAPGLLVSLQREHWTRVFWLAVAIILVQEGIGSMAFGSAVLLYGLLVAAYLLGCRIFEAANPLFMLLLGLWYGLTTILVRFSLAGLQDILLPTRQLPLEFLSQSLCFVLVWFVVHKLYARKVARHARGI